MRAYMTLVRRELSGFFISLTGYVIISAVLLLLGVSFSIVLFYYNGEASSEPLTELFYNTMFFWLILLVATPVITMKLFAHEEFTGTFETLMTTPVSDLQVVLAKFSAAFIFYALTWLPLLACLHIVHSYAYQSASLGWWPVASTFLGILLLGGLYVAMGCLGSAVTRSQIIAVMVTFAMGVTLFLLSFLKFSVGSQTGWMVQVVTYVSLLDHMEDLARGVIDTRHVVFYLSFTVLFLFLTLKVIESRRWK